MPKSEIKLPREHFSWSQLWLWENKPWEYKEIYFEKGKVDSNNRMEFGKKFAEARDSNDSDDEMIENLNMALPAFKTKEKKLTGYIKVDGVKIKLIGKPDSLDMKSLSICEDKTGTAKWTQKKVDGWGQLSMYSLLLWLDKKKLWKKMILNWAQTEEDEYGNIELTGHHETFETSRDTVAVLQMANRIKKAIREISIAYINYLKENGK